MTEQPRTFTAPKSGRYHFASGQTPHPVQDCTEACPTWDVEPQRPVAIALERRPSPKR